MNSFVVVALVAFAACTGELFRAVRLEGLGRSEENDENGE
jgi:hypothetical protein